MYNYPPKWQKNLHDNRSNFQMNAINIQRHINVTCLSDIMSIPFPVFGYIRQIYGYSLPRIRK